MKSLSLKIQLLLTNALCKLKQPNACHEALQIQERLDLLEQDCQKTRSQSVVTCNRLEWLGILDVLAQAS